MYELLSSFFTNILKSKIIYDQVEWVKKKTFTFEAISFITIDFY